MHINLPHIDQKSYYQFITFRTKDSTDTYIKKLLDINNLTTKSKQYKIDSYLDNSSSGAYLNGDIVELSKNYLLTLNKDLCEIIAFTIMPNHIHILLLQHDDLSKIVQQIKGALSFLINKKLNRTGTLWQKDYFDKAIRDQKHFDLTYLYIKNNALKTKLQDAEHRFYGIYR